MSKLIFRIFEKHDKKTNEENIHSNFKTFIQSTISISKSKKNNIKETKTDRAIVEKRNKRRISFLFKKVEKNALFFSLCEKRNWKKSLFISQKMCHFSFFHKERIFFFFHVKKEIEKIIFFSLMWKGLKSEISSLFSSLNDHPENWI